MGTTELHVHDKSPLPASSPVLEGNNQVTSASLQACPVSKLILIFNDYWKSAHIMGVASKKEFFSILHLYTHVTYMSWGD